MRRRVLVLVAVVALLGSLVGAGAYVRTPGRPAGPVVSPPQYEEPADNGWAALVEAAEASNARGREIALAEARLWDEDSPEAQRLVQAAAGDIAAARAALAKECLQPRPVDSGPGHPQLYHLRVLARLLLVAGRERERRGDADGAAALYGDVLRLTTAMGRNGFLVQGIAAVAMSHTAAPNLERCVGSGRMTAAGLRRLASELERAVAQGVRLEDAMAVEYTVQRQYLEDAAAGGQPPGRPGLPGLPARVFVIGPALREADRNIGPLLEALRKPYWQPIGSVPVYTTALGQMMYPDPDRLRRMWAWRDAVLRGLQVHVACQRHLLRQGAVPVALDSIPSDLLPEPPVDPFDGNPFKYRVEGHSYVLYSVAEDRQDDGGRGRFDENAKRGDLILWPWGPLSKPRPRRPAAPPQSP